MLQRRSRAICVIRHMFPGLDLHCMYTDPAQHLIAADTGPTTVDDLDDLDRDLSEVCMFEMWR